MAQNYFPRLERKKLPLTVQKLTPENNFWNEFQVTLEDKLHKNVPFVRISPSPPYDFAVCSSYELRLFRSLDFSTYKRLNFQNPPICCDWRKDNNIIAVGGSNGLFRLYNNSKSGLSFLRALKGHNGEVHELKWSLNDNTKIISTGNDKSIRYWDISESSQLGYIKGHSDFVRCGTWLSQSSNNNDNDPLLFLSGSYDHTVKLWDLRTIDKAKESNDLSDASIFHEAISTFDHTFPIESVVSIPNSDIFIAGGGPEVSIWSLKKNNVPINRVKLHRKSITSLCINAAGNRLITGCLDHFVRVFDINTLSSSFINNTDPTLIKNTHIFEYDSAVMSLDLSPDDMMLICGTLNNGLIVRQRYQNKASYYKRKKNIEDYLSNELYSKDNNNNDNDNNNNNMDGMDLLDQEIKSYIHNNKKKGPIRGTAKWFTRNQFKFDAEDRDITMVNFGHRKKLKQYEIALKQFRYHDALDYALEAKDPLTVASVLEELWRRDGIEIALTGRTPNKLIPILEYIIYTLPHPHISNITLHICAIIINLYNNVYGIHEVIDNLFKNILFVLENLILKYKILLKLQGTIDMILSQQDVHIHPITENLIILSNKIQNMINNNNNNNNNNSNDDHQGNGNNNGNDDNNNNNKNEESDYDMNN